MSLVPDLHEAAVPFALLVGATGAATDLQSRRIPNWLTLPAMLAGLALHAAGGWHELGGSLLALLVAGVVFLVFFLAGGMGAGDVKLMAAEACILGWGNAPALLVLTALAGGALALGLAVIHGRVRQTLGNVAVLAAHHRQSGLVAHPELNVRNERALRLPYALAIAAGVMLTVLVQVAKG